MTKKKTKVLVKRFILLEIETTVPERVLKTRSLWKKAISKVTPMDFKVKSVDVVSPAELQEID